MPFVKGSPLDIATEGLLDEAIGIATDGFIVEEVEEIIRRPPYGGIIPRRIVVIGDWRQWKKLREDAEILELLG